MQKTKPQTFKFLMRNKKFCCCMLHIKNNLHVLNDVQEFSKVRAS